MYMYKGISSTNLKVIYLDPFSLTLLSIVFHLSSHVSALVSLKYISFRLGIRNADKRKSDFVIRLTLLFILQFSFI